MDTEISQPDSPELPEPEPSLHREEFFACLQQELLHKRNFGSFIANAQDGLRRAEDYPLPFPIMEPEFEKDEVSNIDLKYYMGSI